MLGPNGAGKTTLIGAIAGLVRAVAGRETRRVLSLWTQTILPPMLTAVLFLAVFGGFLGKRIHDIEGLPYLSFILPGLLVMTVAAQSFANCSTSLNTEEPS
ncbi:MAG TPA: hypothetical protein VE693_06435 [Gaiellaceae bacterium]|nr:hypothetical protein [Gaiellaceae bacterium]